jgi:hypothetical protein
VSIDSEVVLQILRRSPQGFTPFEILDYLLTQPQYQGCSRASLFSKLLPELQNLRDSQVVAHVSPRWMLVEAVENITEELSDDFQEPIRTEEKLNSTELEPKIDEDNSWVDNDDLDFYIEILNLSTRVYQGLKRVGINTIRELWSCSDEKLLNIKKFGSNSISEIRTALANFRPPLNPLQTHQLIASSNEELKTTRYALSLGKIPSKPFATIAEEIDYWLGSLNDNQEFVLKQRLGLQSGDPKSLADIGQELEISRERVRQIEQKAISRLTTINNGIIFTQIQQVAIEALESIGCISTLEDWCEAIAKTYPTGEIHLPSVILWLINFIPEIKYILISKNKFFYKTPLIKQIFLEIQAQIREFWKEQRISDRSQLHQVILPLLPEETPDPEKVANLLISAQCYEPLPNIFSSSKWNSVDYAYYVLHCSGKPLHFSNIGDQLVNLIPNWDANDPHRAAQSYVDRHPEIIRCGSGIYGLREWGTMEYSHFREVLLDYLSKQPLPVDAEDIYVELSQSYPVSRATVSMNLNLHPNLFHKFGRSNIYGVAGRRYELPEQNLINLLVAKLEVEPVSIYDLERDPDFCEYNYKTINLYLNVSPLFWQVSSSKDRKFALSVDGKRKYEVGDALKIIQEIFNQVHEPLHSKDFLHMIRSSYAYPPREGAFGRILTENKDYMTITEAIFIPREWMSDEALSPILEDLDTELFREIVAFTLSSARKQLSASVLFDWLKFCYQNRFFYRGSLIFERINLTDLSDEIVQITRKIGKVCQRNGDISVLNLGQDANSEEIDRTLRLDLEDLRQQAQSGQRTPSKGLASKPDGKYRVRHVEVGVEVHVSKGGGTDNPYAHVLQVLLNGEPFDPSRHNPIPANTATLEQRQQALQKLYATELTAYGQVDSYLQVAIGPRPSWGIGYRQMEPLSEPATGDVA